jgi:rhomboid family GlyGly-CTERM serine protease
MPEPRGRLWLACAVLLAAGALLGRHLPAAALEWRPGAAAAQPWRWWTAAFVHWTPMHLVANLGGLAAVAALGRVARVRGMLALAWVASWPLVHLSLWLRPDLAHYGGLSGVLHAGVAVAAIYVGVRGRGPIAGVGWMLIAGLAAKVLLEEPWGPALRLVAGQEIAVAPLAHAAGAFWGAVCAMLVLAREAPTARDATAIAESRPMDPAKAQADD